MLKVREGADTLTPACLSLEDSHQVTHDDAAEGDGLEIPRWGAGQGGKGFGFWFSLGTKIPSVALSIH